MDPLNHTVFLDYAHAGSSWMNGTDAYEIKRDDAGNIIPRIERLSLFSLGLAISRSLQFFAPGRWRALWRVLNCLVFVTAFAWFIPALGASSILNAKGTGRAMALDPAFEPGEHS